MADSSTLVMPKLGLTMTEGTITEWRVQPGERFDAGQIIAVVETEKIANEVEAPAQGLMNEHVAGNGETVAVGSPIARWSLDGQGSTPETAPARVEPKVAPLPPAAIKAPSPAPVPRRPAKPSQTRVVATPLARRIAREGGIDLKTLTGSGPGGRIKAADDTGAESSPGRLPGPGAVSANSGILIADVNAGELLALIEKLADVADAGVITSIHVAYLAIAKALSQQPEANQIGRPGGGFAQGDSPNIGVVESGPSASSIRILGDVAAKTVRSIAAEAAQWHEQQETTIDSQFSSAAVAVAEAGLRDITYMSFPVPPGYSSTLGIGAPKETFKPDAHKQPALVQEIGLILSYDQTAMSHASAAKFLSTIKSYLESPLRLLAG